MITNIDKLENKLKAIKSAKNSPKLEEMEAFRINDRTVIYFKVGTSDDKIKERLARHIENMEHLDNNNYVPTEPIKTNNKKNE